MTALDKWDSRFMELATHVAEWSKDPKVKVGSVITTADHRVMSLGYNGFPRGVEDLEERLQQSDVKLKMIAHAERNALDNVDTNIRGCTMYATLQPCADCAKSMIQRGITRLVCRVDPRRAKYHEEFTRYSMLMFNEAGVEVVQITVDG